MHGVKMGPFASPNKAMFLKNINDPLRNFVLVFRLRILIGTATSPLPVIGIARIQINGNSEGMIAQSFCAVNVSPIESPTNIC